MANLYVADFSDPKAEHIKVTVQASDDLSELKTMILKVWGTRGVGLAAGDLRLWKVCHWNP